MVCVVLCAGGSRRFGEDKAFQSLCGRTLVERVVDVAKSFGRVRLVLNPNGASKFKRKDVEIIVNTEWEKGISTSVKKGLEGLSDDVLVFLCDMPLITVKAVARFLEKARGVNEGIVFPVWKGKKGFPTLIRRGSLHLIYKLEGDEGFKKICREFPDICMGIDLEDDGYYLDVDTVEDLRKLEWRCKDGVHEL